MTDYQFDTPGISPDASRRRIDELVTNYSDEELGRMVREALRAKRQAEIEQVTTLRSFRRWLVSVGLGWVVTAAEKVWEVLKGIFA